MINSEAAATKPVITAFDTKLTMPPSRRMPSTNMIAPARNVMVNSACGI
jgi:hypothetical protein